MDPQLQFIIDCVQQFWPDMPISEHLLKHPTSEFVMDFYQHFQETMNDVCSRTLNSEPVAAEEPKVNDDLIFSILRFVNNYLKKVSPTEDCFSLTLLDLYEPTAKRTKLRFKILLNFMLFYQEKLASVGDAIMKQLEKVKTFESKKQEKEILKEKFAKKAEKLAYVEDSFQKLQKEEEKANLRYKNLEKQKGEKEMQQANLLRDLQESVDCYKNKEQFLKNVKTSVQSLNEKVVTEESYKSLLDLKENLVQKYSKLETEMEFLGNNLANRRPEIERFDKIIKDLNKLSGKVFMELCVLQNASVPIDTQLQKSVESYNQKAEELKAVKESTLKYKERVEVIKERILSATVRSNNLKEKMIQQLEQFKKELNDEQHRGQEVSHEQELLQEEIQQTEGQIDEIISQIENLNLVCADTYKNILQRDNANTNNFYAVLEKMQNSLPHGGQSGI